jgi:peptidoglycan/LPS O-acetylase OafA/YrhL
MISVVHIMSVCRRAFFNDDLPFDGAVCKHKGWRNFVFLNNQLPNGGCFNISWSLAVQMQFYLMFPLVLLLLQPQTSGFRYLPLWQKCRRS